MKENIRIQFLIMKRMILLAGIFIASHHVSSQLNISGIVDYQTQPIKDVRVTLFNKDTSFFEEERTNALGKYQFANIPTDIYTIGVEKPEYNYLDSNISLNSSLVNFNFSIKLETEKGKWEIIVQSPEKLGGTDLGILMPNGNVFYCHSTKDPFYFNPKTNDTISVKGDTSVQGCVGPLLLDDEKIWFMGGTLKEVYGPGCRQVKTFDFKNKEWQRHIGLIDYRWYPTVSPLANGNVLIAGGGGLNNPIRVKTSEVYDTKTGISTPVDTLLIGNEVSPVVPLLTGKTLMTHRPPQLFDPSTNQWELAADFVQSNRMSNGDHSDHELVLMPDGNLVAIGYKNFNNILGTFVELYDPIVNKWFLKSSIAPVRSRAKTVLLPDKKILIAGGFKEDMSNNSPVNQWNYMKRSDLYNVSNDKWRPLSDMNYFREYHAIATLVPDGRVIVVGGEGQPGNEPPVSIIEAYKPPYLFRGVRPEISKLSKTSFARGEKFSFNISKTDSITAVQLMSCAINTHFMNSSNNRFIELKFDQKNDFVTAELPVDSVQFPPGFYMLFAMVDDIPSVAHIVKALDSLTIINTGTIDKDITFNVYPNPFTDGFSIQSTYPLQQVIIHNITGRTVLSRKFQGDPYLDFHTLPKGLYFLKMYFGNGYSTIKKIIKI